MKLPDASTRTTDPADAGRLMDETGLGTRELAARLGLSERTLQCYKARGTTFVPMPYPVQYALEALIHGRRRSETRRTARADLRGSSPGQRPS